MMYSEKLAVALKHNGKVLREFGDTVYLPFGQEYTIFVKNLNTVRCVASISIDGTDVGDGAGFIIPALGNIDIERFIKNGNLSAGNRFKFIERSTAVENHRGIKVEDGLIQVTFEFEKQPRPYYSPYDMAPNPWVKPTWVKPTWDKSYPFMSYEPETNLIGARSSGRGILRSKGLSNNISSSTPSTPVSNDAGITVAGSVSNQQFVKAGTFEGDGVSHSIVLKLLGETADNRAVQEPITVKIKQKCSTCGYVNKHDAKFCSQCGTGLQLI